MKHLLKKKETAPPPVQEPVPQITFLRTTTNTEEIIYPPTFPDAQSAREREPVRSRISSAFRRSSRQSSGPSAPALTSSAAVSTAPAIVVQPDEPPTTAKDQHDKPDKQDDRRRLSQRFHLRRHSRGRSDEDVSPNLPIDLPDRPAAAPTDATSEAEWEKRATMLAQGGAVRSRSASMTRAPAEPVPLLPKINDLDNSDLAAEQDAADATRQRPRTSRKISDVQDDVSIQEAIRLHDSSEAGDLEKSTAMFGKLADPDGANNALAQVLYGLALRHGWGVEASPELALTYLSTAASNSAAVEAAALTAGSSSGGAAKGELVLAIYELANSFRHGWGVDKDPVAARQYYETAANLGDVDAMVETATCYTEGVGGPKDKWRAAQYLRRAEKGGRKGVGESWIWKAKYDDPPSTEKEAKKRAAGK